MHFENTEVMVLMSYIANFFTVASHLFRFNCYSVRVVLDISCFLDNQFSLVGTVISAAEPETNAATVFKCSSASISVGGCGIAVVVVVFIVVLE
jgi:hypothetical protein